MSTATLQAFAYFPAMVYRDEHPDWVGYIRAVTQKHFDAPQVNSPIKQTGHMADDPALKFLVDYLLQSAVEILRSQGYAVDQYDFYVSGLWGQDVNCMGGTDVHVHKNSQISGWFFLDTPDSGSYPVYYDTRKNKEMVELDFIQDNEVLNATSSIHFKNVQPGTVMFSNSWMQHQLTQNVSQEKTKSIHFTVSHRDKGYSTCSM